MKTKMLALMLLAGGSMFAQTRFSIGIGIGGNSRGYYQQAPPSYAYVPPCPGPDYTWVDGYWSQDYGRSNWVAGFWRAPVYDSYNSYNSYYVAPRYNRRVYDNDRYERGYARQGYNRGEYNNERNRGYNNGGNFRSERGRSEGRDNGHGNAYSNGFRNR